MRVSDNQLTSWTKPVFNNEDELAMSTEKMIKTAISNHGILKQLPVRVFAKGSYL